nr:FecR domain-containing protein [uncultured Dyadobacter sp.]
MQVTPELIKKYHLGQCSPEEEAAVAAWLAGEDEEEIPSYIPAEVRETVQRRIWDGLTDLDGTRPNDGDTPRRWMVWRRYAGIAASVGLLALFLFKIRREQTVSPVRRLHFQEVITAKGEKKRFRLPDSSVVYLNADSRLRFPDHFTDTSRQVYLTGEAFFEVAKDPGRPFSIQTRHTTTRVLGTVFDLKAYPDEETSLVVIEGKVRFGDLAGRQTADLTANQLASYNASAESLAREHVYAGAYAGWKENRLVFRDSPLKEMTVLLERWYGLRIEIRKDALRNVTFTGTYDNPSLETILNDMSSAMKFTYTQKGKQLIIQ